MPLVLAGALLRTVLNAGAFTGARPPVDLLAVCLVLRQRASARCTTEGASGSGLTLPFEFACVDPLRRCRFIYALRQRDGDWFR